MKQLLVVDTNVLLKQMDLLERDCPALTCIVILQTVAEEVSKHLNCAHNTSLNS
jgi:PIN domain